MSLYQIAKRLTGWVPEVPLSLAQDSVNKALGYIYDSRDWSFQRPNTGAGWLAPGVLFQTGTTTTTPGSPTIICNATLTTALAAYAGMPLITQMQYRNPGYSIYNIIGYNPTGSGSFATLTLDRPWGEPTSGGGQPFMIYQVYFVAPVQDFRKFIEIRDTTDNQPIDFWSMTQARLAAIDPQRQNFSNPAYAVPAGVDSRAGSATLGWQLFELWPQQGSYVPYTFTYLRRGPLPQSQSDWLTMTPPYPLTEELVEWRAKEVLCQFKEAQKDKSAARGSGANWVLLSQMAHKEYMEIWDKIISIDVNLYGEELTRVQNPATSPNGAPFATLNGAINLGGYNGGSGT